MSHPRVEEVSDSDLSDPSEGNISDFDETDILRVNPSKPAFTGSSSAAAAAAAASSRGPAPEYRPGQPTQYAAATDAKKYAGFQCLYPIYFSAQHSRQEGRRVAGSLAVANPIARDIAHACSQLGLQVLFEPGKSHPRDWANPGRVRVKLRDAHRPPGAPAVNNKHHLYRLVAQWLQRNPTTDDSQSLRYQIPGVPVPQPGEAWPRPAIPKGWKMNELLPFVSPAMTGGGVSENLFKDMMKEMQGGGDPMAALMNAAGGPGSSAADDAAKKKKKDKKGKGKA